MDLSKKEWTKYILLNYKTIPDILNIQILEKIDWDFLSNEVLPIDFISKYILYLDIRKICQISHLNDEFIIKYKDWLDWDIITLRYKLTPKIINKCKSNILLILNAD